MYNIWYSPLFFVVFSFLIFFYCYFCFYHLQIEFQISILFSVKPNQNSAPKQNKIPCLYWPHKTCKFYSLIVYYYFYYLSATILYDNITNNSTYIHNIYIFNVLQNKLAFNEKYICFCFIFNFFLSILLSFLIDITKLISKNYKDFWF